MTMKPKMLYLMHIDWSWIKQRPQYIEEALEEQFDVTVICTRNYRLKEYKVKDNVKVFYSIPFIRRFPWIWKIDVYRKARMVGQYIKKNKPEYIYLTSPQLGACVPKGYSGTVIYDCMDDMLAFNTAKHYVDRVSVQEKETVDKSEIILASSSRLKELLSKRYPYAMDRIHVVRNGYDGKITGTASVEKHEKFVFCYFGTISHWFNFDFILRSLEEFDDIEYLLIGPVEGGTSIPSHSRIIYMEPVDHDKLQYETRKADAFIMPFQLNDLILSVDPVKLYEYINIGKDILCIEYPEIERFKPFVHFFHDYSSFKEQIAIMTTREARKYTDEDRIEFLSHNTWDQRANQIIALLRKTER